jgi:hypothetical protein
VSGVRIDRRAVLRGLGGAIVGLPALEIMTPRRAWAKARPPTRFVISYGGISTGAYQATDQLVPDVVGPHYDVKRALEPLAKLGIRDDVSLVTGLVIPWQEKKDKGAEVPPGGRTVGFHYNTVGPQLAGTRTGPGRKGVPKAPTADQLVADAIAGDTRQRVLAYRVQPVSYVGGNQISGDSGRLSWRRAPDGSLMPQDPIASPRVAYESLFGGFVPPERRQASQVRRALDERRSVLDLVGEDMQRLMARLGPADRNRMERHFEEVRGLERRLEPFSAGRAGRACAVPPAPGADPPFGGAIVDRHGYSTTEGYSDEERRAELLGELLAVAFACDLSRVASYMLTEWKCYMNMYPVAGWKSDMHELTHGAAGNKIEAVSDCVAWCVKVWGRLVARLRDLPEADGTTVLDHTAMTLVFEGGHGYDPEGNRKNSPHSTENMAVLVAGRAGGLASGRHVRLAGGHPASAVLSAMNAAGFNGEALGDVRGNVPGLFG